MSKCIRFLQNKEDFMCFCKFIYENKLKLFDFHAVEQKSDDLTTCMQRQALRILPDFDEPKIVQVGKYSIFSEDSDYIEFNPCMEREGIFYEGSIILHESNVSVGQTTVSSFEKIKKYIKGSYKLSDDKICYIAPYFYREWKRRNIATNFLIEREELKVLRSDYNRNDLIKFLSDNNYIILSESDCRKPLDLAADVLVFVPKCYMYTLNIKIDSRIQHISRNARCVFLISDKCHDIFLVDKRLIYENDDIIIKLFSIIKDYLISL